MSAVDTFEWYVSSFMKEGTPEIRKLVAENRDYLLSLRSEDERRRFVEGLLDAWREEAG
ncbi:MAG TPA: hypothetical protein VI215_02935 [Bacteroidota bacterium]|jgi:hypothetical protein